LPCPNGADLARRDPDRRENREPALATTLLRDRRYHLHMVHAAIGDGDVSTAMIYTHVMSGGGGRIVRSPFDRL
jgi:hypothetical protein